MSAVSIGAAADRTSGRPAPGDVSSSWVREWSRKSRPGLDAGWVSVLGKDHVPTRNWSEMAIRRKVISVYALCRRAFGELFPGNVDPMDEIFGNRCFLLFEEALVPNTRFGQVGSIFPDNVLMPVGVLQRNVLIPDTFVVLFGQDIENPLLRLQRHETLHHLLPLMEAVIFPLGRRVEYDVLYQLHKQKGIVACIFQLLFRVRVVKLLTRVVESSTRRKARVNRLCQQIRLPPVFLSDRLLI